MGQSYLVIEGARQNNLKNISLRIPHNKLTVITGVSGAGKSSLAMDTIFAEAHTRYVESLSTYSRLFLERIDRPDLDNIRNIRPAILLEQRNPVRTSRSTVGTVTEIYDYLRLLFAKIGTIYCPDCNMPIHRETPEGIADKLCGDVTISFSTDNIKDLLKKGFVRIKIGNKIYHLEEDKLPKRVHSARVIVDRLRIKPLERHRLVEALETAFREGDGTIWVNEKRFTTKLQCPKCSKRFREPEPYIFSFNHPLGACPKCKGFGNLLQYDICKVIPNPRLSLEQGAIEPWTKPGYRWWYESLSGVNIKIPFYKLSPKEKNYIKQTLDDFFNELERKRYKLHVRVFLSRYKSQFICPECKGSRLRPEGLQVKIKNKNIYQITQMTVKEALDFFNKLDSNMTKDIIEAIRKKLDFLYKVGLDYLTLDRQTRTLSGGEAQRVNLAQQLGMGLTGTLYILDEPTIGLHARDVKNLAEILKNMTRHGNTLIVVEHDRQIIESADYIVKLGPGAGENGGRLVYCGYAKGFKEILPEIPIPNERRKGVKFLKLTGVSHHNLKNIDVIFPLNTFICITGVSGSGKSSLIQETLYQILAREFHQEFQRPGLYKHIQGIEYIKGVKLIDQEPISRSPRSNPATYIGVFSDIRHIMADTEQAKVSGFNASDFSFNTGKGRCPVCQGEGYQKMEMYFLADVYYRCEECGGKRFKKEILDIKYKGKNIDEILQMTVDEAIIFFEGGLTRLNLLKEVGLGYLRLGQPLSTLSGGEAQRLKIASELSLSSTRDIVYILDEPTTGLHLEDIKTLLKVLNKLVDEGNTVIVIEHNLDIIKCADYIIDLGPEGGQNGGYIVACGTPEEIAGCNNSYTGRFLREYIN